MDRFRVVIAMDHSIHRLQWNLQQQHVQSTIKIRWTIKDQRMMQCSFLCCFTFNLFSMFDNSLAQIKQPISPVHAYTYRTIYSFSYLF